MKFSLQRIKLNSDGYTSKGTYYGVGAPLYRAKEVDSGDFDLEFRASCRAEAREIIKKKYSSATFFN